MATVASFCDRTTDFRMMVREIVEDLGASVDGYDGAGVQLTMPADNAKKREILWSLQWLGGSVRPGSVYWFPACNNEPESQWHFKRNDKDRNRCTAYAEYTTVDFAAE